MPFVLETLTHILCFRIRRGDASFQVEIEVAARTEGVRNLWYDCSNQRDSQLRYCTTRSGYNSDNHRATLSLLQKLLSQPLILRSPPTIPHPAQAEHERSDATYRLAAALRDLAAERAEGVARLAVLRTDLRSMVTALEKAEVLAAAAKEEAVASQRGLEDLRDEAEGLKKAAGSAQRRAEVAEDRARKLATAEKEREAGFAQDIELAREEGREQERRKGEQR